MPKIFIRLTPGLVVGKSIPDLPDSALTDKVEGLELFRFDLRGFGLKQTMLISSHRLNKECAF